MYMEGDEEYLHHPLQVLLFIGHLREEFGRKKVEEQWRNGRQSGIKNTWDILVAFTS